MDLERFRTISTKRLSLRPQDEADPQALVAGLNEYEVSRWLTRVAHPYTRADAADIIAARAIKPAPVWLIHDSDGLCGGVGLDMHLGFWLTPRVWGRGYMTEAARAVLVAHFTDPLAGEVGSSYFIGNTASARLLEKLGFQVIGPCRLPSVSLGHEVDAVEMVLTRADWLNTLPLCRT